MYVFVTAFNFCIQRVVKRVCYFAVSSLFLLFMPFPRTFCAIATALCVLSSLFFTAPLFAQANKGTKTHKAVATAKEKPAANATPEDAREALLDSIRDVQHDLIDSLLAQPTAGTYWQFSTDFANRSVYNGRNYDIDGYSLTPTLAWTHKSGFNISATATHLDGLDAFLKRSDKNAVAPFISDYTLALGYDFELTDAWSANVGYSHLFLNYGSASDRAALSNYLSAGTSYDFSLFAATLDLDYVFGRDIQQRTVRKKTITTTSFADAFYGTLNFNRAFSFYPTSKSITKLVLTPAAQIDFGNNENARSVANINTKKATISDTPPPVQFLNYEASTELKWVQRRWELHATPHVAFPVNLLTNDTSLPVQTDNKSYGQPVFYFVLGGSVVF